VQTACIKIAGHFLNHRGLVSNPDILNLNLWAIQHGLKFEKQYLTYSFPETEAPGRKRRAHSLGRGKECRQEKRESGDNFHSTKVNLGHSK